MKRQRALRLAREWAQSHICNLRAEEAAEYYSMFAAMLEESMSNEPLTLEQIKSLYDSPAWYQDLYRKMGYWIIVGAIGEIGVHLTDLDNANEFYSTIDYGARWALFRRPPEGEDGDADRG